jgi:hypothetical protein
VPFELHDRDFEFIMGDQNYKCNLIVAEFLSPKLARLRKLDPSISEYKLDEFIITDFKGNIIGKFDKNGLQTTQINSNKIILNNEDLEEKIANIMDNEEL